MTNDQVKAAILEVRPPTLAPGAEHGCDKGWPCSTHAHPQTSAEVAAGVVGGDGQGRKCFRVDVDHAFAAFQAAADQ